jgi:hypothetical protein
VLLFIRRKIVRSPPQANELHWFFLITSTATKQNKGNFFAKNFWDSAKPSVLESKGITTFRGNPIPWSDKLVDDIKRTMKACVLFLYYPVWILNNGGIGAISTLQAKSMRTDGQPNDVLANFNVRSTSYAPLMYC